MSYTIIANPSDASHSVQCWHSDGESLEQVLEDIRGLLHRGVHRSHLTHALVLCNSFPFYHIRFRTQDCVEHVRISGDVQFNEHSQFDLLINGTWHKPISLAGCSDESMQFLQEALPPGLTRGDRIQLSRAGVRIRVNVVWKNVTNIQLHDLTQDNTAATLEISGSL